MSGQLSAMLQQGFGFSQFRPGQQQVVENLLAGYSSLAVFPTGSGKSLCYQFTATQLPHLTLVVSPLLALIKDQLDFLNTKRIAAASIDSTLTAEQSRQVMQDARNGKLKILMVSVERFKNERFRSFIQSIPLSMLVVDEAHCISEWGHNFRPDYLKLPDYRNQLNIPLVLLLTATATAKVKHDMAERFAIAPEHIVQTGFYRANLHLQVCGVDKAHKQEVLLQQIGQQAGSGVVYVTLQQSAEQLATELCRHGIRAAAYHAGMGNEVRQQVQQAFMHNRVDVVVATIAFGMGIDKSDIRFVIHYDLPKSIENYSQEIGRAGRDGKDAQCTVLANLDSLHVLENFVYGDTPELSGIKYVVNELTHWPLNNNAQDQWEVQLSALSTASNIRQLPLKTLLVQLEMMGIISPRYSYYADFKIKLLAPQEAIVSRFQGERQQFVAAIFAHIRWAKIWGTLNFEQLLQHYASSRQRVVTALDYLAELQLIVLEAKGVTDVYQVIQPNTNEAELSVALHQYFVDKERKEIARIGELVALFESEGCLAKSLANYFDDNQAPAHCGHCHSCLGQATAMPQPKHYPLPADEQLSGYINGLQQRLNGTAAGQGAVQNIVSIDLVSRFLAGLTVPVFARNKVRQLPGYASCERCRYHSIRHKVAALMA